MSIEPTCDFCGASDKFRCKDTTQAAGCESYREKNRAMEAAVQPRRISATQPNFSARPKPGKLPVQISMTINGPRGPITVKESGDTISVQRRDDDPLYLENTEVEAMIACLGDLLNSRK